MSKLPLSDIASQLSKHQAKTLSDSTLPIRLVEGSLEEEIPLVQDNVTVTVRGDASIDVFNSQSDSDPVALFGPPPSSTPPRNDASEAETLDDFEVRSPITFALHSAWLAYRTKADMKVHAGFEAPQFVATGKGTVGTSVLFHDYRRHEASEVVLDAVKDDVAGVRFVLSERDVRSLDPGDALAMEVTGTLSASINLEWSDVLTSHVGALGRLLEAGEDFGVDLRSNLRAEFDCSIRDHFLLVFTKINKEEIALAITKSGRRTVTADVGAGVVVGVAKEEQLKEVGKAALEGLLGNRLEKIEQLLKAASLNDLEDGEREIVEGLLDRLGLDDVRGRLAALAASIEKLKSRATAAIKEAAEEKARFAVDLEYSRIGTDDTVVEASFDMARLGSQFSELHSAAVALDLKSILTLDSSHGVTIHRFLRQKTTRIEKSWGVSLSLGDVFAVGGKSWNVREETTRWDQLNRRSRYSFLAVKGYAGEWGDDTYEWKTTLAAKSRNWTDGTDPSAASLDYSLHLLMQYGEARVSGGEIGNLVDLGVLWGMVTAGGAGTVQKHLASVLEGREDVEISFHVTLMDPAVRFLLDLLAGGDAQSYGFALGRAVPWLDQSGRDDPAVRQYLYGGLWSEFLQDSGMSERTLANKANGRITAYRGARRTGEYTPAGRAGSAEPKELAELSGLAETNVRWPRRGLWVNWPA